MSGRRTVGDVHTRAQAAGYMQRWAADMTPVSGNDEAVEHLGQVLLTPRPREQAIVGPLGSKDVWHPPPQALNNIA
jgi:hypothetical protein